jgi:hypothetical protein
MTSPKDDEPTARIEVNLTEDEKLALDDFCLSVQMPSRVAALRELLERGLGVADQKAVADKSRVDKAAD